jgi:hypothetical protein
MNIDHWKVIDPRQNSRWFNVVSNKIAASIAGDCVVRGMKIASTIPDSDWQAWQDEIVSLSLFAAHSGRISLRQK